MCVGVLHIDEGPILRAYPHHKGHKVFVVVSGAAAEDVQALVVTRATQLTNRKLHPVINETEWVCVCVCVYMNGSVVVATRVVHSSTLCVISVHMCDTHDIGPWQ